MRCSKHRIYRFFTNNSCFYNTIQRPKSCSKQTSITEVSWETTQMNFSLTEKIKNTMVTDATDNLIDFVAAVHLDITEFLLWKWEQFFSRIERTEEIQSILQARPFQDTELTRMYENAFQCLASIPEVLHSIFKTQKFSNTYMYVCIYIYKGTPQPKLCVLHALFC